jgi:DNA-binding transcriptional MerR regulator
MNDDRQISKKEVLEQMRISYGQLYRWKRKGLIPESWFVRRSTFTGQETFFPRDKILERIEQIKEMKGDHPLDDLAEVITQHVDAKLQVAFDQLKSLKWFDDSVLETCRIDRDRTMPLTIQETLCVAVLSRLRQVGRSEELDLVQRTLTERLDAAFLDRITEEHLRLYLLRKRLSGGGISAEISMVAIAPVGVAFDPDIEQVETVDLGHVLERIKLDLAKEAEVGSPDDRTGQDTEADNER